MKCPACGAENPNWKRVCGGCGKTLPEGSGGSEQAQNPKTAVDSRAVALRMKMDYLHGIGDSTQRRMDGIQGILAHFRKPQLDIDTLLLEAANMISKTMGIDNVSIGLRDPKDGLYRYRAMVGFRTDATEGHKLISYSKEQFSGGDYHGTDISKMSRVYLAEDNVLTESDQKAFNRPGLLGVKRTTTTESLEGDYIDIKILGQFDDLLGWIEISGTRSMQLPDTSTIKCVELIASIIGTAIMYKTARG